MTDLTPEQKIDEIFQVYKYKDVPSRFLAIRFDSRDTMVWIMKDNWSYIKQQLLSLIQEEKIKLTNELFDGWIDYETNVKWKYMSRKHRDQVIEALKQESKL